METSPPSLDLGLAQIVEEYRVTANIGTLFDRVRALAALADPEQFLEAARPCHDMPEVVIPAYEHIVAARPQDAQAMVVLANAYWLTGRGADVVGELAPRAHRRRRAQSRRVAPLGAVRTELRASASSAGGGFAALSRGPARARALADNATSLAGAEHDPAALDLAIVDVRESCSRKRHVRKQRAALQLKR